MGIVQKDAFRTMLISYIGIALGYLNKGLLFLIILTTEQIGLINLIYSLGILFAQMANFGALFTTWKFLPFFKNTEKKHHGFLPFILLIVFIGIVIFTLLTLFFQKEIQSFYSEKSKLFNEYYLWVLPIGISYVLYMIFEVYLRAFYKNIFTAFALEIVLRIALTLLLFLLWFQQITFHSFVILHSLIYIIPTMLLVIYLKKMNEFNLNFSTISISKKFKKIIIQYSAYNYINTLGVVLVNSLDVIMLAQIIGLKGTGIYSTTIFLASAIQVPYKSLIKISAPLVSDHWKHREFSKMKELYQKVSSVSLFIGFFTFIPIWLNIDFLFSFLKPEFHEGKWVFLFIMVGRLLDMYFGLNGSIFSTSKKYKFDIFFTLFLIGTVFGLNLLFIPKWGITGAAISTSFALIFYNIGRLIFVWYVYKMHPFTKHQFIILLLAFISLLIGHFISKLPFSNWQMVVAQCVTFFGLFVAPVYLFKLEIEVLTYLKKGRNFISSHRK